MSSCIWTGDYLVTHNSSFVRVLCDFSNRSSYEYSKLLKWLIPIHAIA